MRSAKLGNHLKWTPSIKWTLGKVCLVQVSLYYSWKYNVELLWQDKKLLAYCWSTVLTMLVFFYGSNLSSEAQDLIAQLLKKVRCKMNYVQLSKWIQSTGDLLTTYPVHCTWCVPVLLGITLWWTKFSCSHAKEVYISAFCVTYFILEKLEYGNVVWPKAQGPVPRKVVTFNPRLSQILSKVF